VKREGAEHQKRAVSGVFVVFKGRGRGRGGGANIRHVGTPIWACPTCLSEEKDKKHTQTGMLLVICVGHWHRVGGGVSCGSRVLTHRGGGVVVVESGGGEKG